MIDWTHPLIGANPFMMTLSYQAAITITCVEAWQKQMVSFMTTGVFHSL